MTPQQIDHTVDIALYLRQLLAAKLRGGLEPQMPDWPVEFLEEMHYAMALVTEAIKNKSVSKTIFLSHS